MRRFHFPLEFLLRWHELRLRQAEVEQAQALHQWWEAAQQVQALQRHGQELSEAAFLRWTSCANSKEHNVSHVPSQEGLVPDAYWFLLAEHLRVLHQVEQLARRHEAERRQVWEQRNQHRRGLAQQTEIIKLLRRQAWLKFRRELRDYHQRLLDEMALRGWYSKDSALSFFPNLMQPLRAIEEAEA
ncbi:MAG: hypothetical protein RMI91_14330 [Gemmatales bacterium]|nr:hypothetical protein [Gemmatales bacterium]MDW7995823.1 hypothetical protein [Gemmatales bacterium]